MTAKNGASEPARCGAAAVAGEEAKAGAGWSLMGGLLVVEPAKTLAGEPLARSLGPDRRQQPLGKLLMLRLLRDGIGLRGDRAANAVDPDGVKKISRARRVAQISDGGVQRAGPHLVDKHVAGVR